MSENYHFPNISGRNERASPRAVRRICRICVPVVALRHGAGIGGEMRDRV
jgi:hypothetical protein